MILVTLTAVLVVCGAAELEGGVLFSKTPSGSFSSTETPFGKSAEGFGVPSGGYTNDAQGVVVDAAAGGTRTSGAEPTGLGGPRTSYGSTDSKVGGAAFKASLSGFGSPGGFNTRIAPGYGGLNGVAQQFEEASVKFAPGFSNNAATQGSNLGIGLKKYTFGFNNGINSADRSVSRVGIKGHGGYTFEGDSEKQHSTDGTYDAHQYNENSNSDDNNRPSINCGDATASVSFVSGGIQDIKPNLGGHGSYQLGTATGQGFQGYKYQSSGNEQLGFDLKDYKPLGLGITEHSLSGVTGNDSPVLSQLGGKQSGDQKITSLGLGQGFTFGAPTINSRLGVQTEKLEGSDVSESLTSTASEGSDLNKQDVVTSTGTTFNGDLDPNVPSIISGNSAYSSTVITGSGSASAFASIDPIVSGITKDVFVVEGSKTESASSGGAVLPNIVPVDSNINPSITGSAVVQGQSVSAQTSSFDPSFPKEDVIKSTGSVIGGLDTQEGDALTASLPVSATATASLSDTGTQHTNIQSSDTTTGSFNLHSQLSKDSSKVTSGTTITSNNEGSQDTIFSPQPLVISKPDEYTQTGNYFSKESEQTQSSTTNGFTSGVQSSYASGSVTTPTKVPSLELTTPFKTSEPGITQQAAQTDSTVEYNSEQYKPSISQSSIPSAGSVDASSEINSGTSQSQGGTLYYYNKPAETFVRPTSGYQTDKLQSSKVSSSSITGGSAQISINRQPNVPITSLFQQSSKYSNTPVDTTASQPSRKSDELTSSSQDNRLSQTSISFVPNTASSSPSSSSSQFGAIENQQTLTLEPVTTYSQKPIQGDSQYTQESYSQTDSSLKPLEPATIYEYNKPTSAIVTTTTSKPVKSSQTVSQTKPPQISFGAQNTQYGFPQNKPFVSTQPQTSTFRQTQFGYSRGSQFNSNPNTHYNFQPSPFNSKPFESLKTNTGKTQIQESYGSQISQKTQTNQLTGFQQTQFGTTGNQQIYSQKPQTGTIYQYNKPTYTKDTTSVHVTSSKIDSQTKPSETSFGSQGTQFGTHLSKPLDGSQSQSFSSVHTGLGVTGNQQTFPQKSETVFGQTPFAYTQSKLTQQSQSQIDNLQRPWQSTRTVYEYNKPSSAQVSTYSTSEKVTQSQTVSQSKPSQNSFGTQGAQLGFQFSKPFDSSQIQTQQSQFGISSESQSIKKPPTQTASQSIQFASKRIGVAPSVSSSSQSRTQFGSSTGSQYAKNPATQSVVQTSAFGLKPYQSSLTGTKYQQTQFGATGSYETATQKPVTQFSYKPVIQTGSQYAHQTYSQTDSTLKPLQPGTIYDYNKPSGTNLPSISEHVTSSGTFSQIKPSQSLSLTQGTQFGLQQPIAGSITQEAQFGSSSGSQSTNNPTHSVVQTTHFGETFPQKPVTHFNQKPVGQSESQYTHQTDSQTDGPVKPSQLGTIYEYNKPISTKSSTYTSEQIKSTQTVSQTKPSETSFGSLGTQYGYQQFKPYGNSLNQSSTIKRTQFGSSIGSQFSKNPTTFQSTQFATKPFGSSQTDTSIKQPTQESTGFQTNQITGFGNKHSSTFPQTQFGTQFPSITNSQSEQKYTKGSDFSGTHTGTTQYTQYDYKPQTYKTTGFGNTLSNSAFQKSQSELSFVPKLENKPQSVATASASLKPLGTQSIQGTYSFSKTSEINQKPQLTLGTTSSSTFPQGQRSLLAIKPITPIGSSIKISESALRFPLGFGQTLSQGSTINSGTLSQGQTSLTKSSSEGVSNPVPSGQSTQLTQFGQKPLSSSSATGLKHSQFQLGSFGSLYVPKLQIIKTENPVLQTKISESFDKRPYAQLTGVERHVGGGNIIYQSNSIPTIVHKTITDTSSQSSSGSFGPFAGYNYKKPQSNLDTPSTQVSFDQLQSALSTAQLQPTHKNSPISASYSYQPLKLQL